MTNRPEESNSFARERGRHKGTAKVNGRQMEKLGARSFKTINGSTKGVESRAPRRGGERNRTGEKAEKRREDLRVPINKKGVAGKLEQREWTTIPKNTPSRHAEKKTTGARVEQKKENWNVKVTKG